jgi:CheY-like chemotaxis protein
VVITDVIMPDQDGYSVCSQVKQNPQFAKTPVILMSGVVNKSVADRAVAVQADELVRKPFQPQELISRVKNLIGHGAPALQQPSERTVAVPSLSSLFSTPAAPRIVPPPAAAHTPQPAAETRAADNVWPRALAEAFVQQGNVAAPQAPSAAPTAAPRAAGTATDIQKLRVEISRLEILVKKLQTELQIERQYNQALELHVRTLTQID